METSPEEGRGRAAGIQPDRVREQLRKILSSPEFSHAESLRRFLSHAVEAALAGQSDRLKESVLGVEVFGRSSTFDPRVDPIVRVQAVKLRTRLERYYAADGRSDPVVIEFPKGGYVPRFRQRHAEDPAPGRPSGATRGLFERVVFLVAFLGTAAGGLWLRYAGGAQPPLSEWRFRQMAFSAGTTSAFPAMSRQGNLLVFASDRARSGHLDLYLRGLGAGDAAPLTFHPAQDRQPDFSPDGTEVVFQSDRDGGGLWVVSLITREERKLTAGGYLPRYSPDGSEVAFLGTDGKIYKVPARGGEARGIGGDLPSASYPVWTPDGRYLLVLTVTEDRRFDWTLVPASGGRSASTGAREWLRRHDLGTQRYPPIPGDWLGQWLVFSAGRGSCANLWAVKFRPGVWQIGGETVQLTTGPGPDTFPRAVLLPDGRAWIVFTREQVATHLWALALPRAAGGLHEADVRLTDDPAVERDSLLASAQISADGSKLVYCSTRSGSADVYLRDLTFGKERVVAGNPWPERYPVISPDGSHVAYVGQPGAGATLYAWDRNTATTRRLCENCGRPLCWAADNRRLLLAVEDPARLALLDAATGRSEPVWPELGYSVAHAALSPDGRWIVVRSSEPAGSGCAPTVLTSFPEGLQRPCSQGIALEALRAADSLGWAPDGAALLFLAGDDGFPCLYRQSLDSKSKQPIGGPVLIRHFHQNQKRPVAEAGVGWLGRRPAMWLSESASSIWLAEAQRHWRR